MKKINYTERVFVSLTQSYSQNLAFNTPQTDFQDVKLYVTLFTTSFKTCISNYVIDKQTEIRTNLQFQPSGLHVETI